jgi:hypothetical protein
MLEVQGFVHIRCRKTTCKRSSEKDNPVYCAGVATYVDTDTCGEWTCLVRAISPLTSTYIVHSSTGMHYDQRRIIALPRDQMPPPALRSALHRSFHVSFQHFDTPFYEPLVTHSTTASITAKGSLDLHDHAQLPQIHRSPYLPATSSTSRAPPPPLRTRVSTAFFSPMD